MSERLIKLVNDAVIKDGVKTVAERSGLAEQTILAVKKGRSVRQRNAYKLALACGCSEEDALAIAYECASKAKESA